MCVHTRMAMDGSRPRKVSERKASERERKGGLTMGGLDHGIARYDTWFLIALHSERDGGMGGVINIIAWKLKPAFLV